MCRIGDERALFQDRFVSEVAPQGNLDLDTGKRGLANQLPAQKKKQSRPVDAVDAVARVAVNVNVNSRKTQTPTRVRLTSPEGFLVSNDIISSVFAALDEEGEQ